MSAETLLLDSGFMVLAAIFYTYVGRVTIRRRVEGEGQLAATLFGVWWFALAGLQVSSVLMRGLALAGVRDVPLFATFTYVTLLGFCLAFWALVYYLVYLLSGSRRVLVPITMFYAAFYGYLLYWVTVSVPNGIKVDDWSVSLTYANQITGAPVVAAILLLILPPILGGLGYARLYFRVSDATQKYRIGLVSATITVWFGLSLLAWVADVSDASWWHVATRVISLGAAALIYSAYRPPSWVRRRWGIEAADEWPRAMQA